VLQVWSILATLPILLGTASVLLSTLLYGGAIKVSGDYWNRGAEMCDRARRLGASEATTVVVPVVTTWTWSQH
jgi:hypothetical protein